MKDRPRKKGAKARAQIKHAKKRALQRYGLVVGEATLARMVELIQKGKAKFVERQSNRVSVFDVEGRRVVYDKDRKTIVTFLPASGKWEP